LRSWNTANSTYLRYTIGLTMNFHPIFVHFPIALFTLYGVFELVRFSKVQSQPYWFYIKAILVILGTLAAFVTLQTGEMIKRQFPGKLTETHSFFANITTYFFAAMALAYITSWIERDFKNIPDRFPRFKSLWTILLKIKTILLETKLTPLLALVGLVLITITGALGGSIAYGPDIDPVAKFVYNLLIR